MTKQYLCYQAYGLTIHSEFEIPYLPRLSDETTPADLIFRRGIVAENLTSPIALTSWYQLGEREVLLIQPGLARFSVHVNYITVDAMPDADEARIIAYLLGSCFGALLQWRQILPLHASVTFMEGTHAVAFVGDRQAGKSTTAALLHNAGHKVLCDDIAPIRFSQNKQCLVGPGIPQIKLAPEVLNRLGEKPHDYHIVNARGDKYSYPISIGFNNKPEVLNAIIALEEGPEYAFTRLHTKDAIAEIAKHTFRRQFIFGHSQQQWYMDICSKIVKHINIYKLTRPKNLHDSNKLTDFLHDQILSI